MQGHMLEVELNTLDPKSFDNIQDFVTKFKYLLLSSCECGIYKVPKTLQIPRRRRREGSSLTAIN
jgi:hypothetical protein